MIAIKSKVYAQLKDNVGHTVTQWSEWSTTNCHKGLAWRSRQNFYTGNNNGFTWEYEVKNNYGRQVSFSFKFGDNETAYRKTLTANQVYKNTALPNSNYFNYAVYSVCFSSDGRCKDDCYSPCDNGTPNIPICNNTPSSLNTNSNSSVSSNKNNLQEVQSQNTSNQPSLQELKDSKTQQRIEVITQVSQATISIINSIKEAKREQEEIEQKQIAEVVKQSEIRNQKNIEEFNKNKDNYYSIVKMENEELGYYTDFFISKLEKEGFYVLNVDDNITLSIPLYHQYEKKKSKICNFKCSNMKDTLSVSVEFLIYDESNSSSILEQSMSRLERNLKIRNLNVLSQTNNKQLSDFIKKICGNDIQVMDITFSEKRIEPLNLHNIYSNKNFISGTFKGHKIEFPKSISIDTSKTILAFRHNALIYKKGVTGKEKDKYDAIEWFLKAVNLGDTLSKLELADTYYDLGLYQKEKIDIEKNIQKTDFTKNENIEKAFILYKEVANYNKPFSAKAMLYLGSLYDNGLSGEKDCAKAIEWTEKAATTNTLFSIQSLSNLAYIYKNGCNPNKRLLKKTLDKLCKIDPKSPYCE